MRSIIYKYKLNQLGITEIEGHFAEILTAKYQGDDLYIWAQVSSEVPLQLLKVYIMPTGIIFERNEDIIYLNTIQKNSFVWHIFYEIERL